MTKFLSVFAAAALTVAASAASADTLTGVYTGTVADPNNGTGSDIGALGSFTLSADMVSPGLFEIVGGTLDVTSPGASGIAPGIYSLIGPTGISTFDGNYNQSTPSVDSPSGLYAYDNVAATSGHPTLFDDFGLLFVGAGGIEINFWGNADGVYNFSTETNGTYDSANGQGYAVTVGLINDIPEPASFVLLAAGLAVLATKRRRQSTPS